VLALTVEGLSCGDIAQRLQVSVHTVYVHNKRILKKLGVTTRTEAIARFREDSAKKQA
jgi:DNA-binding CsgD family transcriptional regulator